jgi:LysR family cys regulon transcriptional activator
MKLQQLRYVVEVARQGLNVSAAAEALHTSQPGVSKQIRQLELELGVDIFERSGKRLCAITEPGVAVIEIAERILTDSANLKRAGAEFANETTGTLRIATTHTQARYALPTSVTAFKARFPNVTLTIHQGSPTQLCALVASGEADIAIATEAIANAEPLISFPCYQWNRCVVVPPNHPLLNERPLTLETLAQHPIVTYDAAFAGRASVDKAFARRNLSPEIVLAALDSDVIKTYVELGLGVGIVAQMAFDPQRDQHLRAIDAAHLFESSTTRLGVRRGSWLRGYVYAFIELFAPHLESAMLRKLIAGESGSLYAV